MIAIGLSAATILVSTVDTKTALAATHSYQSTQQEEIQVFVNNKRVHLDPKTIIKNGRTLIPL